MKKIFYVLFYIYLTFLLIYTPYDNIIFYVSIPMLVYNIFLLIKNKYHFDRTDLFILIIPVFYLIILLLRINLNTDINNIYEIISSLTISLTVINIRRYNDKKFQNSLLIYIPLLSAFNFIISFISHIYQYELYNCIKIFAHFSDTFVNSIDRFYGLLNYCNASAILFLISFFICLFRKKDKDNIFNRLLLFINFIGFVYTFSKMISICLIIIILVLIIYYIIKHHYQQIKDLIIELGLLLIPMCLATTYYRNFLINANLFLFIKKLIILFLLYYLLLLIVRKIKKQIYVLIAVIIEIICIIILLFIPILIPLKINNVALNNSYYITELFLKANEDYELIIDYDNFGNDIKFVIEYGYVKNNVFDTYEYIIMNDNIAHITGDDNCEYYLLKVVNLNKKTNLVINSITLNGKIQNINTFLIPYQFSRQLDLIKYDKESVTNRFTYYKDSINYLKRRYYLFGGGVDTFEYYRINYYDGLYGEINPHSILFYYWLDIGIIGVIYIIYIYTTGIITMIKKSNREEFFIWFIIFTSLAMFSSFDLYLNINILYLIFLISYVFIIDYQSNHKLIAKKSIK